MQFGSACSAEDLVIGMAYNQKEMYKDAIAGLEKRRDRAQYDPRLITEIGYAFALSGQTDQAKKIIEELNELGNKRFNRPYYYLSALISSALGDKDEAFRLLEKSYEYKEWFFPWLNSDARFNPLRSDPRFKQLLQNLSFIES